MGIKCGGYYTPQRENNRSQPALPRRAVVPRYLLQNPHSLPEMTFYRSDSEYRYFKVISERVHREGGRHGVLLQICQTEPLIRRAFLTLAALETSKAATNDSGDAERRETLYLENVQVQNEFTSGLGRRNPAEDRQKAVAAKEIRDARRRLLDYLCRFCFKDVSSDRGSELPEALLVAFETWTAFLNRGRSGRVALPTTSLVHC